MRPASAAALLALVATTAAPTWRPQSTGVDARLRGVSAVTDKVAWASGTGGTVLRTTNGGDTWIPVTVPNADALDFRDIDAIDENVAAE